MSLNYLCSITEAVKLIADAIARPANVDSSIVEIDHISDFDILFAGCTSGQFLAMYRKTVGMLGQLSRWLPKELAFQLNESYPVKVASFDKLREYSPHLVL